MAALAAVAAAAAAMTLWWPMGWDQASFSQIGAAMLDGAVPYRDAFEMRGPAALYLFEGIVGVFGRHAASVRVFDALALGAFGVVWWRLLRPFAGGAAVVAALALWTLYLVSLGAHFTAQPDAWVGYAAVAAVALGARPGGARRRELAAAGAVVAFCALNKPFYLGYLGAVAAAVGAERGWRPAALVRPLAVLAAGCAVPVAVVFGVLAARGAFPAFVDAQVWYNLRVYQGYGALPPGRLVFAMLEYLTDTPAVALALPAAGAGWLAVWRRARPLAAGMAVLLFVGLLSVALQRKLFLYHWFPFLVGVAVLASAGVGAVAGPAAVGAPVRAPARAFVAAYAMVLALAVGLRAQPELHRWEWYLTGRKSAAAYYGEFSRDWELNPADQMRMAAYLRARTAPGTPVGLWGYDAAVPFLAGRPMVGRFTVSWLLTFKPAAPMVRDFRRQYADAMRAARPPYVVRSLFADQRNHVPLLSVDQLLPELGGFVGQNYVYEGRLASFDVYRRADYQPPR